MKGVFNGSRIGMRAMKSLRVQCKAQAPKASVGGAPGGMGGKANSNELPSQRLSSTWSQSSQAKRPFQSTRLFSNGTGGGAGGTGGGGGGGGGNGGGSSGGAGAGLWAAYLALLERKPVATKAVTAGLLNGVGDVIAQLIFNDEGQFDWKRLTIFTMLGLVFIGPALHVWYGTLASASLPTGTVGALSRMAMDQLLFAPFFVGSIVALIVGLEGHPEQVPSKLKNDLFTIIRSNWALWVPFQFVNFRFVPVHLQVLASNVVALGWNTYMSWASHK